MQEYNLESEDASIVLVGSFNPAIFHPEWLLRHQLITQDDVKGAKIEIVHNDLSKFSLEWLGVDVLRNKFIVRTNDPSQFSPMRDLMISVFGILEHMPITQLGMNSRRTYKIDKEEHWHKVGDVLAPKMVWEESLPKRVGLTSLTVRSPRPDSLEGHVNVSISSFRSSFFGVNFDVNNHVELGANQEDGEKKYDVSMILAEHWDSSLDLATKICETTLLKVLSA